MLVVWWTACERSAAFSTTARHSSLAWASETALRIHCTSANRGYHTILAFRDVELLIASDESLRRFAKVDPGHCDPGDSNLPFLWWYAQPIVIALNSWAREARMLGGVSPYSAYRGRHAYQRRELCIHLRYSVSSVYRIATLLTLTSNGTLG